MHMKYVNELFAVNESGASGFTVVWTPLYEPAACVSDGSQTSNE